jgi:hypothetical protein
VWVLRIRQLCANDDTLTPTAIARRLDTPAERARTGRTDPPHRSTVQRVIDEFPEEARGPYRYVHWPESFVSGALPWEAASALLEELRFALMTGERFSVRWGSWYWRLRVSAPNAPRQQIYALAGTMTAAELVGVDPAETWREVERYLAEEVYDVPMPGIALSAGVDPDTRATVLRAISPALGAAADEIVALEARAGLAGESDDE